MWYGFLRTYPVRFYRQKVLGAYIVDFYCAKAKLAIELDGSQHYTEEGAAYDARRTAFLSEYGITVLRISNPDVERNISGVCEWIDMHVKEGLAAHTATNS